MDQRFEAFSTGHYVMLGLFLACIPLLVWQGRRVRGTDAEVRSRRALAIGIVASSIPMQILQFTPGDWDLRTSLPFQLCDLAWMAAAYGLWTRSPRAMALTCYWGLTLTTQAMITPNLAQPFPHPRFIGFWAMHALVVWAAVYLLAGLGFRLTWRLYGFTVAATATWAAAVMAFNFATGTNYGFLNRKPATASILDVLGPWPGYVLLEIALVAAVWAVLTVVVRWLIAEPGGRAGEGYRTRTRGADMAQAKASAPTTGTMNSPIDASDTNANPPSTATSAHETGSAQA